MRRALAVALCVASAACSAAGARPVAARGAQGADGPELFGVGVIEVRTSSVPSKPKRRGYTAGRTREWKKAVIQVREGESIPIFQGLEAEL